MPLIRPSSASVVGRLRGDLPQRGVVEDHVGGHALLLGRRPAPGPQPLEDRRDARRAARPRPACATASACAPPCTGSRRSSTVPLAAQHRSAGLGEQRTSCSCPPPRAGPARAAGGPPRATRPRTARCRRRTRSASSWPNCSTFGVRLPEQDVDDLPGAEPLVALAVQPEHRREQLLRGDRAVPRLRRHQAGVAVAARLSPAGRSRRAAARGGTRPSRTARASRRGAARACGGGAPVALASRRSSCAAARRRRGRRPARRWRAGRRDPARPVSW